MTCSISFVSATATNAVEGCRLTSRRAILALEERAAVITEHEGETGSETRQEVAARAADIESVDDADKGVKLGRAGRSVFACGRSSGLACAGGLGRSTQRTSTSRTLRATGAVAGLEVVKVLALRVLLVAVADEDVATRRCRSVHKVRSAQSSARQGMWRDAPSLDSTSFVYLRVLVAGQHAGPVRLKPVRRGDDADSRTHPPPHTGRRSIVPSIP